MVKNTETNNNLGVIVNNINMVCGWVESDGKSILFYQKSKNEKNYICSVLISELQTLLIREFIWNEQSDFSMKTIVNIKRIEESNPYYDCFIEDFF